MDNVIASDDYVAPIVNVLYKSSSFPVACDYRQTSLSRLLLAMALMKSFKNFSFDFVRVFRNTCLTPVTFPNDIIALMLLQILKFLDSERVPILCAATV